MKLKLNLMKTKLEKVGDTYKNVIEHETGFTCRNYDDLQNLFLSMAEASDGRIYFSFDKEDEDGKDC